MTFLGCEHPPPTAAPTTQPKLPFWGQHSPGGFPGPSAQIGRWNCTSLDTQPLPQPVADTLNSGGALGINGWFQVTGHPPSELSGLGGGGG